MGVPTKADLRDLDARITQMRAENPGLKVAKWDTLYAILKWVGEKGAMSGVSKGLTAVGAPVVKTGITVAGFSASFTPVAWALGPWIGAYQVGSTYSTVSSLYDLLPEHSVGPDTHPCSCGRCSETIGYVIDKFEWHAAETGVAVATLGVSEMLRKPGKYLYRKITGTEKKLPMCEALRRSADPAPTGSGCKKAQAAIFVLMKDPKKAVATIAASDGGSHLKSSF